MFGFIAGVLSTRLFRPSNTTFLLFLLSFLLFESSIAQAILPTIELTPLPTLPAGVDLSSSPAVSATPTHVDVEVEDAQKWQNILAEDPIYEVSAFVAPFVTDSCLNLDTEDDFRKLILCLGDDDFDTRETAQARLVKRLKQMLSDVGKLEEFAQSYE